MLIAAAAIVIVVAGLKAAAPIVNFFLLALFIAVATATPVDWLRRQGLPPWVGVLVVVIVMLLVVGTVTLLLANSLSRFGAALPTYQAQLEEHLKPWLGWLQGQGIDLAEPSLFPDLNPKNTLGLVANLLGNIGSLLSNTLLILVVAIFMLLDGTVFQRQLQAASTDPRLALGRLAEFSHSLRHYLAVKTWISLITGISIGCWCALIGLEFAVMWGLLAFLFNFVPNIGSIIAAVPAVLLAFVQGGMPLAASILLGYMLVNVVVSYFIEPRVMGRSIGLSASVVMLSLIFWGWVLGPVGMILAVPLTVTLKLVLAGSVDTRWLATLLDVTDHSNSPAVVGSKNQDNH